ncbi:MAG: TonB-dependent receptor [Bacteroidetes bacterium]|nr:TonB-dependent receptor [Bacteroidota bacterium]
MDKVLFTFLSLLLFQLAYAQQTTLKGYVSDAETNEHLMSATVQVGNFGTITNFDGSFELSVDAGSYEMTVSYVGYKSHIAPLTFETGELKTLSIQLDPEVNILQTATVTGGRYEQALGEATVSLEVLKPSLIESTNARSIDEALEKIPGVTIIDGQANIRGGSGYSYGAGSRVLVLIDDIPFLQADSGSPSWEDMPLENTAQIEVLKGAGSALYGSSALNGVINLRTAYAKSKPETKASIFYTSYLDPAEKNKIWWDKQPGAFGGSFSHRQKIKKLDLVLGGYYIDEDSYNQHTYKEFGRLNVGTRYRISDKINFGFNSNFNKGNSGAFFYWAGSDSLTYRADENSKSIRKRFRYYIDPFVNIYDGAGNRHKFLGRFYNVDSETDNDQSIYSNIYYGEYQFSRKWNKLSLVTTAGLVGYGTKVTAPLYGDGTFTSQNLSAYLQVERKFFNKLNLSAGFRYEDNTLENPAIYISEDSTFQAGKAQESKPVFRVGANYQAAEFTYLRASWGQGYRYPTIAEKFIDTKAGGLKIKQNPYLTSETGWSAEVGIKQGFRVSEWKGFIDVAGFWSEYQDMMEFNFTFEPPFNLFFQSQNIGNTIIKGVDLSIAGEGNLFGLPTTLIFGYTFIDPKFQEFDISGKGITVQQIEAASEGQKNAYFSSVDYNILKYRFQHSVKFDLESKVKNLSLGIGGFYNSNMEAIDAVFNTLSGIEKFRSENDSGFFVFSARAGYQISKHLKVSLIGNNLLNEAYSLRPGLMEAPRNLTLRADLKL